MTPPPPVHVVCVPVNACRRRIYHARMSRHLRGVTRQPLAADEGDLSAPRARPVEAHAAVPHTRRHHAAATAQAARPGRETRRAAQQPHAQGGRPRWHAVHPGRE